MRVFAGCARGPLRPPRNYSTPATVSCIGTVSKSGWQRYVTIFFGDSLASYHHVRLDKWSSVMSARLFLTGHMVDIHVC